MTPLTNQEKWSRFKDLQALQKDWLQTLSKLRREQIEQWKLQAEATGQWQTVRLRELSMRRMQKELHRVDRFAQVSSRRIDRLVKHSMNARYAYVLGQDRRKVINMWKAWTHITSLWLDPETLFSLATQQVPESAKMGLNSSTLLSWMEELRAMYSVPSNDQSKILFMTAFSHLPNAATESIKGIELKMEAMKAGAYDYWKPGDYVDQ